MHVVLLVRCPPALAGWAFGIRGPSGIRSQEKSKYFAAFPHECKVHETIAEWHTDCSVDCRLNTPHASPRIAAMQVNGALGMWFLVTLRAFSVAYFVFTVVFEVGSKIACSGSGLLG